MSLQKAIQLLEKELRISSYKWSNGFEWGFRVAINCLRRELTPWVETGVTLTENEPSPDTQYKKDLTAWIEAKQQAGNPYSIFEAWQKKRRRKHEASNRVEEDH